MATIVVLVDSMFCRAETVIAFFEQKRFSAFQDEISEMDEDLFRAIVDDDVDC